MTRIRRDGSRPRVYVVGDSITAGATSGLQALRPNWDIDGEPGRRVATLPSHLRRILDETPSPACVVIALGTNASPEWSKDSYADAIRMLPAATEVRLVTTYRSPKRWGTERPWYQQAWIQAHYSRWMNELAEEMPNVSVVRWRLRVKRQPRLLQDGVHPTARGKDVWANMIAQAPRKRPTNQRSRLALSHLRLTAGRLSS